MTYSDGQCLSEDCPLTKEKETKCKPSDCCGGGLKFIITNFITLTIIITAILILQLIYTDSNSHNKTGFHGAVATDYANCSQIGTKILRRGGNAVDAAVAATVCMAVVAPHKTGLGGGGYIMIYNHKERSNPVVVDFASNTAEGINTTSGKRIPAVMRGLELVQNRYGVLPWHMIIEPSVKLAREGFVVSEELAHELSKNTYSEKLYGPLNAGDILQLHNLANTLDNIGKYGANVIYNGSLSDKIMDDKPLSKEELKQLAEYKPLIGVAKNSSFYEHIIYYPEHASTLYTSLNTIKKLNISSANASAIASQVLVAEALIHSDLMSSHTMQNIEQRRYTGVMTMDWQDFYTSIVTGLSEPLGSRYMNDAGFLLDEANDNDALTMLVPIILHNEEVICGLRGIFGLDDITLTAQLMYNLIVRAMNISAVIEYPRYYLLSDGLVIENDDKHTVDSALQSQLASIIPRSHVDANSISKSVNAIIKQKDSMTSHSDSRGGGLASRF